MFYFVKAVCQHNRLPLNWQLQRPATNGSGAVWESSPAGLSVLTSLLVSVDYVKNYWTVLRHSAGHNLSLICQLVTSEDIKQHFTTDHQWPGNEQQQTKNGGGGLSSGWSVSGYVMHGCLFAVVVIHNVLSVTGVNVCWVYLAPLTKRSSSVQSVYWHFAAINAGYIVFSVLYCNVQES